MKLIVYDTKYIKNKNRISARTNSAKNVNIYPKVINLFSSPQPTLHYKHYQIVHCALKTKFQVS